MKHSDDHLPALDELRENLRRAARQEGLAQAPSRRFFRRGGLAVVVGLVVLGGGATAAVLLSTGDPVEDHGGNPPRYRPVTPGIRNVDVVTRDPAGELRWGVSTYETPEGQACAVAGAVSGGRLGALENGVFRPYAPDTSGPCGDLARIKRFHDVRFFPGEQPRTLVYGRVRRGSASVTFTVEGETYSARSGHGGAFLLLFEGRVDPSQVR